MRTLSLCNALDEQLHIYLNHHATLERVSPVQRWQRTVNPQEKKSAVGSFLHSNKLPTGACIITQHGSDKSIHFHMRDKAAAALCSPNMWSHRESQVTHLISFLENANKHHNYHLALLINVQLTDLDCISFVRCFWRRREMNKCITCFDDFSFVGAVAVLYINCCPPCSTKCDMLLQEKIVTAISCV